MTQDDMAIEDNGMFGWWGYLHTNGSIQAKRYFDERDIHDAYASPFVLDVVGPFQAANRDDALQFIAQQTTAKARD